MIIFGFILQFIGFLLCLTVIGAVIGVPLLVLGGIVVIAGFVGRRKTVIQNVVTVQNAAPVPQQSPRPAPIDRGSPTLVQPEPTPILPTNPEPARNQE